MNTYYVWITVMFDMRRFGEKSTFMKAFRRNSTMTITNKEINRLQLERQIEVLQLQELEWEQVKEFHQKLASLGHSHRRAQLEME